MLSVVAPHCCGDGSVGRGIQFGRGRGWVKEEGEGALKSERQVGAWRLRGRRLTGRGRWGSRQRAHGLRRRLRWWGAGGGRGQQKQNAPRAKKLRRAPPEGSAQWCCTRQMEVGKLGRRAQEEGGTQQPGAEARRQD